MALWVIEVKRSLIIVFFSVNKTDGHGCFHGCCRSPLTTMNKEVISLQLSIHDSKGSIQASNVSLLSIFKMRNKWLF